MNKMSVKDLKDLKGKKVLVRCDFNVPMKDIMEICVAGMGIIGGSICLALKRAGHTVYGWNRKLPFARIWASPTPFFQAK